MVWRLPYRCRTSRHGSRLQQRSRTTFASRQNPAGVWRLLGLLEERVQKGRVLLEGRMLEERELVPRLRNPAAPRRLSCTLARCRSGSPRAHRMAPLG